MSLKTRGGRMSQSRELVSFSRRAERPRGSERNEDFVFLPENIIVVLIEVVPLR